MEEQTLRTIDEVFFEVKYKLEKEESCLKYFSC